MKRLAVAAAAFICVLLGSIGVTRAAGPATRPALPDDTKLDLFLLVGQSNMSGRGKVEPQDQQPDPRVWMLNQSKNWTPAVDPMHFDKAVAGVGPGRTFGITVATACPDSNIGLVPCAVGGTSIDQWKKGGKLYTTALARAKTAMNHGTFKAILWHQGEADAKPAKMKVYSAKLTTLIADFRADLNAPELPFVLGQLGPFVQKNNPNIDDFNAMLLAFAKTETRCACVSSDNLTSNADSLHFNAASQREFGRRYAAAYLKLADPSASK